MNRCYSLNTGILQEDSETVWSISDDSSSDGTVNNDDTELTESRPSCNCTQHDDNIGDSEIPAQGTSTDVLENGIQDARKAVAFMQNTETYTNYSAVNTVCDKVPVNTACDKILGPEQCIVQMEVINNNSPQLAAGETETGPSKNLKSLLAKYSDKSLDIRTGPPKKVRWSRTLKVTLRWRRAYAHVCKQRQKKSRFLAAARMFRSKNRLSVNFTLAQDNQQYVNPAFELEDDDASPGKFADVVEHIIKQPSASDLHPYGRGNLYASIFRHRRLDDHTDSGKLISWVVVMVMLVALAGGVVVLAVSWESEHPVDSPVAVNISLFS